MKCALIDVVNFNADASCLPARQWLAMLDGSEKSLLYQWLKLYVRHHKKITLGFSGATIADIVINNPECVSLINAHPDIFEIIWRPFAHDLGLLRSKEGFLANVTLGRQTIEREFKSVTPYFLPPEFMITAEQIGLLCAQKAMGTFINPQRFPSFVRDIIPSFPYQVKGILGSVLNCVPFNGFLTNSYLHSLHEYDGPSWNNAVFKTGHETNFLWRDGESPFLVPDGIARESYWLAHESPKIKRQFLKDMNEPFVANDQLDDQYMRSYPVHSITDWLKELRMWGFLNKVRDWEGRLQKFNPEEKVLWLSVINSDILSAVEKDFPIVRLKKKPTAKQGVDYVIKRSERGFEGEDYLAVLEQIRSSKIVRKYVGSSKQPHIRKLRARQKYLTRLQG